MAEPPAYPLQRPLPHGIVPEEVVTRTEKRWVMVMAAMLIVMIAVIVVTGVAGALHPASNVEVIEPQTLHLGMSGASGGSRELLISTAEDNRTPCSSLCEIRARD